MRGQMVLLSASWLGERQKTDRASGSFSQDCTLSLAQQHRGGRRCLHASLLQLVQVPPCGLTALTSVATFSDVEAVASNPRSQESEGLLHQHLCPCICSIFCLAPAQQGDSQHASLDALVTWPRCKRSPALKLSSRGLLMGHCPASLEVPVLLERGHADIFGGVCGKEQRWLGLWDPATSPTAAGHLLLPAVPEVARQPDPVPGLPPVRRMPRWHVTEPLCQELPSFPEADRQLCRSQGPLLFTAPQAAASTGGLQGGLPARDSS